MPIALRPDIPVRVVQAHEIETVLYDSTELLLAPTAPDTWAARDPLVIVRSRHPACVPPLSGPCLARVVRRLPGRAESIPGNARHWHMVIWLLGPAGPEASFSLAALLADAPRAPLPRRLAAESVLAHARALGLPDSDAGRLLLIAGEGGAGAEAAAVVRRVYDFLSTTPAGAAAPPPATFWRTPVGAALALAAARALPLIPITAALPALGAPSLPRARSLIRAAGLRQYIDPAEPNPQRAARLDADEIRGAHPR